MILRKWYINFNLNSTRKQNFMDLINSYAVTQQNFDNTRQTACLDNIFVNFMGVINFKTEVLMRYFQIIGQYK